MKFVQRNRDFFEHYARGSLKFEPAPEGLDTFAFDLEKNTLYVNSRFYHSQGYELSDEETSFAVLHETEHLQEKLQFLGERNGVRNFERYLARIKESQAFSLMDNCVADIRENRTVVKRTSRQFADIERALYREDLFKSADFTAAPRHIQFCQALLRENRIPDERCTVAPEVREKLDKLIAIVGKDGTHVIDAMTHPDTPMSLRLRIQDRFIWPVVKELLDEDMKDKKKGKGKQEAGEDKPNPDEMFADAYAEAEKQNPHAVPVKNIEEALEKYKEHHAANPGDQADQEYADKIGVKKEDLQRYRDIVKSLEQVINPETNESVIEELRRLISRIISRRLKPAMAPRYPVPEGEELVDPTELYTQVKAGNLEPKAWETHEVQERKGARFGEIEITLVCDRSGSMEEGGKMKLYEQRKAAVLLMEALKEFADRCDEERMNMDVPLEVRSEIYAFDATSADRRPLKALLPELDEKTRIEVSGILSSAPGQRTTDFMPLEAIGAGLSSETKQKITDGELKKIVIVFTDGNSDDPGRVQLALESLRDAGVVAVGVGITQDGAAALTTYAPEARLAEKAEHLARVLRELLQEHLVDV